MNGSWVQLVSDVIGPASKEKAGLIIVGDGLIVDENGVLSLDLAKEVKEADNRPVTSGAVYDYVELKINQEILEPLMAI